MTLTALILLAQLVHPDLSHMPSPWPTAVRTPVSGHQAAAVANPTPTAYLVGNALIQPGVVAPTCDPTHDAVPVGSKAYLQGFRCLGVNR